MKAMKRNRVVIYISVVTEIILVVLCVIKYIPVYNIYIGKLRAKDLIERLETYKKQHGEYPETLKPIGFPKAELGESVEYKGTCYYYIRQSECDFDLEMEVARTPLLTIHLPKNGLVSTGLNLSNSLQNHL